jgi:hypothetical protein
VGRLRSAAGTAALHGGKPTNPLLLAAFSLELYSRRVSD